MLSPWPARILILLGSAGVALGTAMPWVSIGYLGGQFHLTEWDVTYLHWPHFVAGIVPLSGAVVAFGIGFLTGRRRIFLHRALAPIAVVFTELGFHYFVYRFGHLGAQIQAIPGVPSSRLGVGFY